MERKRFLTIFHDFDTIHLHKDVGAIPYYLSAVCDWESSLAFFEGRDNLLEILGKTDQAKRISFLSLGRRRSRIRNVFDIIAFVVRNGKNYDVLNFYHDGLLIFLYGFLFKLVNRRGIVYSKLDMDHLETKRILEISKKSIPRFLRWIRYLLSRLAVDLYTVETISTCKQLGDNFYFHGRLAYLPNGFTCENDEDIRSWLESKENILLTVGRLGDRQKFNELLVDAISTIDRKLIEGWKVVFVGPIVAESFRTYVADAVARNVGLEELFLFPGSIEDKTKLYAIYKKAKIFCLTSRWESFGFVLLEAMYFGDYVISSDLPAPRDMTQNGALGALFPVGDTARLAEFIALAITGKVDLEGIGMESHRFVRERFDWRFIVRDLDRLLSGAMHPKQNA